MQDNNSLVFTSDDEMYGKYLTFRVGIGVYGIKIKYVTEIIGIQDITPIPHTNAYVRGIINLRGKIVPVIDCNMRFGHEETSVTERTCIIELGVDELNIGLVVDDVEEVIYISDDSIKSPPRTGEDEGADFFVKNIGLYGDEVKQLLDIEKIFEETVGEV
jgi:purine-binding chemotaxis protein CheW